MIELQGVTKELSRGAERLKVLDSVDLEISEHSYVAIAGRSGSGKSTLLSIVGCVDTPTEGHYRLAGNDISSLPDAGLSRLRARHFGFIFQSFHLLPELTAEENVMAPMRYGPFPKEAWRGRARELLVQVGLGERSEHKPPALSGGGQERGAVAARRAQAPRAAGRRAAADRDRPGASQRPGGPAGGRTHRQPGCQHPRQHRRTA